MGEHKDEQGKPIEGPAQDQPMRRPDKGDQGVDENRKASDQKELEKHSPSPNNPNDPGH